MALGTRAAIAMAVLVTGAAQGAWPDKPLRIIVPFAAGSFTDVAARVVGQELTEQLGQHVIVENRLGAGGTLATIAAARATADGQTLLLLDNSFTIAPGLYASLPYHPLKDFVQVSLVADSPSMLMVRSGLPAKTVADLIELARTKPGALTYGSAGQGSTAHLASELFLGITGARMVHVPFKGVAPAIAEVVSGRIDVSIAGLASGMAQVRAGRARGLGVTGRERSPLLPDVPTFIEAGVPDYRMVHYWGLAVPAGTPAVIVTQLNREIARALEKAKVRELFLGQGARAVASSSAELTGRVAEELKIWKDVIVRAGIKLE